MTVRFPIPVPRPSVLGFRLAPPASRLPLLVFTLYTLLFTTAALWAVGCGSDAKDEAQDAADGGGDGEGLLVSSGMRGTMTVTYKNTLQKEVTETISLDADRAGAHCELSRRDGHYGISNFDSRYLAVGMAVDKESYQGPGTYHGRMQLPDLDCTITVDESEVTGGFTCSCLSTDIGQCQDVRSLSGRFECLGPLEEES